MRDPEIVNYDTASEGQALDCPGKGLLKVIECEVTKVI
jgi:hypothetical protein